MLSGEPLTASEGSAADVGSPPGGLLGTSTTDCGLAGCFGFGARCLDTGVILGKDMEISRRAVAYLKDARLEQFSQAGGEEAG
jgi:hypothetical protein